MHERYLFPAAALALLAYVYLRDKRLLWLSAGFSVTIFINNYVILYYSTNGGAPYSFTLFVTSLLNVLLCIWLAKVVWELSFPKQEQKVGVRLPSSQPNVPTISSL
jgi:Gpi18-like mannosyltransferase